MKRYAVIGASSGTGLELVRLLASRGEQVRAISRRPVASEGLVEAYAADVTDPESIRKALDGNFDVVFYTVDIHQKGASKKMVRDVMYEGCVNSIRALSALSPSSKFVLLSVIGAHKWSWVWWILNATKKGMKRNIVDRERALIDSGLPYAIVRAPRLTDALNDAPDDASGFCFNPADRRLDMMSSIPRRTLAKVLVDAASRVNNSIVDIQKKR